MIVNLSLEIENGCFVVVANVDGVERRTVLGRLESYELTQRVLAQQARALDDDERQTGGFAGVSPGDDGWHDEVQVAGRGGDR